MTTPDTNNQSTERSRIDLLLHILETTNAVEPIAVQTIAGLISIIKEGRANGKTDAEIAAQAADSEATALRTREKSQQQMSDQP